MHVSERFNQAAHQYDSHAYVQRCAGNFAFDLCPTTIDGNILDIIVAQVIAQHILADAVRR